MNLSCPICGSENTQKLTLIYSGGVSNSTTNTVGGGVLGGIGFGATKSNGTATSALASKYAPPVKISNAGANTCTVITLILFGFENYITAFAFALISVGLYALNHRHNSNEFPKLLADWQKQYLCLRCETTFKPE